MTAPLGNFADRPAVDADLLAPPREFADPPATDPAAPLLDADRQPHDLLSELLRSVRLSGERLIAYCPPQPFRIAFADAGTLHIVEAGELLLRLDGDTRAEQLSSGDVVLLPRGDPHHIADTGVAGNDAPESASWLCGTFAIGDPQASPLLASLPAVIILRGAGGPALEGLEVARRMLLVEMQSPSQGSAVMIARILDLIFIQILRAWAAGTDAEPNWLAGAFDQQIGPALAAIHRDHGQNWTVAKLARACNLSRSAFAARFVARVGKAPAGYLAQVRLDAAADLLRDTSLPVALVAQRVGYTSEAAFSRAFKNRHGTPPARWARAARRP